jgi:peptidoglycan-associated lipoprotein
MIALVLVLVAGAGCKSKKDETISTDFEDQNTGAGGSGETLTNQDLTGSWPMDGADIPWDRLTFSADTNLRPIRFDYDSSTLRQDAMATLRENYSYIQSHPNEVILVEGHCDERGTQAYNLALGERRAQSAREYLIRLGASPGRLSTVSYGKERPTATGHDESAWSQNRRGEFKKAALP